MGTGRNPTAVVRNAVRRARLDHRVGRGLARRDALVHVPVVREYKRGCMQSLKARDDRVTDTAWERPCGNRLVEDPDQRVACCRGDRRGLRSARRCCRHVQVRLVAADDRDDGVVDRALNHREMDALDVGGHLRPDEEPWRRPRRRYLRIGERVERVLVPVENGGFRRVGRRLRSCTAHCHCRDHREQDSSRHSSPPERSGLSDHESPPSPKTCLPSCRADHPTIATSCQCARWCFRAGTPRAESALRRGLSCRPNPRA